jgi:hypothetical protein
VAVGRPARRAWEAAGNDRVELVGADDGHVRRRGGVAGDDLRSFRTNSGSVLVVHDRVRRRRVPSLRRIRRTWLRPSRMPSAWAAWARAFGVQCVGASGRAGASSPSPRRCRRPACHHPMSIQPESVSVSRRWTVQRYAHLRIGHPPLCRSTALPSCDIEESCGNNSFGLECVNIQAGAMRHSGCTAAHVRASVAVLRGDMSLDGLRPERPHFATQFMAEVRRYNDRRHFPAGITGWAQVHGLKRHADPGPVRFRQPLHRTLVTVA